MIVSKSPFVFFPYRSLELLKADFVEIPHRNTQVKRLDRHYVPEDPRKDTLPNSAIAIVKGHFQGGQTYYIWKNAILGYSFGFNSSVSA
jgi:hypothetical protein